MAAVGAAAGAVGDIAQAAASIATTKMQTEMEKEVSRINADMEKITAGIRADMEMAMTTIKAEMEVQTEGIKAQANRDISFIDEASEILTVAQTPFLRRKYITDDDKEIIETWSPYSVLEELGVWGKFVGSILIDLDMKYGKGMDYTFDASYGNYGYQNYNNPETFYGLLGRRLYVQALEAEKRSDKLTRIDYSGFGMPVTKAFQGADVTELRNKAKEASEL